MAKRRRSLGETVVSGVSNTFRSLSRAAKNRLANARSVYGRNRRQIIMTTGGGGSGSNGG